MSQDRPDNFALRLMRALVAGGFILFLGHVAGTQYVAHELFYMEEFLGKPLVVDEAMGVKLFMPHKVYVWGWELMGRSVDEILLNGVKLVLASLVLALVTGLALFFLARGKALVRAHGTSRWATKKEIDAAGWTMTRKQRLARAKKEGKSYKAADAVVIGRSKKGKFYYDASDEHLLVFAPTRSGKGVGLVIPTLLTWLGSVVVADMKGECYSITSRWREIFSHVIYLNPLDENSACFNPLLEIEPGEGAISGAKSMALILGTKPEGKFDPFWDAGAVELLTLSILYVLHADDEKHLGRCAELIKELPKTLELMEACTIEDRDVQKYIRLGAASISSKSVNVREGWSGGALLALSLWSDPRVVENTSRSDFCLKDLQFSKSPLSLYLVVPPSDIDTLSPFIRLFFQLMTDTLTRDRRGRDERHRLLMMMDEFPQYGKMEKVEQSIAYTAGYGIKWFFITQGLEQLDRIYGRDNSFLAGCKTRISFRCNDERGARRLSTLIGKTTGEKQQEGASGKRGLLARKDRKSVSTVQFEKDLMSISELTSLDKDRAVILSSGMMPALEWRIEYFKEKEFIFRTEGHARGMPSSPLTDFPPDREVTHWEVLAKKSRRAGSALPATAVPVGERPHEETMLAGETAEAPLKVSAADEERIHDTFRLVRKTVREELEVEIECEAEPKAAATVALDKEQLKVVLEDRASAQRVRAVEDLGGEGDGGVAEADDTDPLERLLRRVSDKIEVREEAEEEAPRVFFGGGVRDDDRGEE